MLTKSPPPTLLTKFTHLFRKSGNEEAGPEQSTPSESPAEASDSLRQLLKRKRRNDAIRVYELSKLRAIIRDGRGIRPRDLIATTTVPTQPRNSGMGSLERTSILDKIDGAEAHLEQWWGSGSVHGALPQNTSVPDKVVSCPAQNANDELELDFTGMQDLTEDEYTARYPASDPMPFSDDDRALTPVENGLRDAALLYAEGEFAAAESTLSSLLLIPSLDQEASELLTFSLFDLYRCSGQHERFEMLAMDYANRFGRSPAEWFSLENKALPVAHADTAAAVSDPQQRTYWKCPPILDSQALADCMAHHPINSLVFSINWLPLQHIDASVAPALAKQLSAWSSRCVELQWLGVHRLIAAVQLCRVSSKVPENEPWWLMQLDMLCLLQQTQEFEELALEYCVAFEVSPPNWKTVACKLVHADEVLQPLEFVTTVPSPSKDTESTLKSTYAIYELCGNIIGDNPSAINELDRAAHLQNRITVSCSRLGRVDINAAGQLFHWVQERQAEGCSVQFTLLPRLVLVYFLMVGMDKLASLSAGPH